MKALVRWLDNRTGIADLLHAALYEHVPGGRVLARCVG